MIGKIQKRQKGVSIRNSVTRNISPRCLVEDSAQTSFSGMGNADTESQGDTTYRGASRYSERNSGLFSSVFSHAFITVTCCR